MGLIDQTHFIVVRDTERDGEGESSQLHLAKFMQIKVPL